MQKSTVMIVAVFSFLRNHNGDNCEVNTRTNPNKDILVVLWSNYPYKDPMKRPAKYLAIVMILCCMLPFVEWVCAVRERSADWSPMLFACTLQYQLEVLPAPL